MENRSIFSLSGISGMLIATLLLLSILAGLTVWAINAQQDSATKFYEIEDVQNLEMINQNNVSHYKIKGEKQ